MKIHLFSSIFIVIIGYSISYDRQVEYLLDRMNDELLEMNRLGAKLEWQSATKPSAAIFFLKRQFSYVRNNWRNEMCSRLNNRRYDDDDVDSLHALRMTNLLCSGPIYSPDQAQALTTVTDEMVLNYASRTVCKIELDGRKCYHGEPDLNELMSTSRNVSELLWAWTSWRNEMGLVKELFKQSVDLQNIGARNNGYNDIGECWREELEIPDLEIFVENLYAKVEHLYRLLHAVVRFRLGQTYPEVVFPDRPIPAHLLGDLWSQNWESLIDLILPKSSNLLNITESLMKKNYTVKDMIKHAEDYYVSLGFPELSSKFWSHSIFTRGNSRSANCHASAGNMYENEDYRIIACLGPKAQDFYAIHHEIGHIQYYMSYKNQPPIYQNGVNSAFHEAIGDSVMLGVMTSQHLQRLGLAEDAILHDDLSILLRQALAKLPELPHALLIDKWRWEIFRSDENFTNYNSLWWNLRRRYMGIEAPSPRGEEYFDPAAKFHIVSNTPYIRYFLANVLQYQLFEGMCEAAVTGKIGDPKFSMKLHRCDIYGSKSAAKKLRAMMSRGRDVNWREWVRKTTGSSEIRVDSLLRYYEPLKKWLELEIKRHRITIGW